MKQNPSELIKLLPVLCNLTKSKEPAPPRKAGYVKIAKALPVSYVQRNANIPILIRFINTSPIESLDGFVFWGG